MVHEINQLKEIQPFTTNHDQSLRCISYEIKLLKNRPTIGMPTLPAVTKDRAVGKPFAHIVKTDSVKNPIDDLEKKLSAT